MAVKEAFHSQLHYGSSGAEFCINTSLSTSQPAIRPYGLQFGVYKQVDRQNNWTFIVERTLDMNFRVKVHSEVALLVSVGKFIPCILIHLNY